MSDEELIEQLKEEMFKPINALDPHCDGCFYGDESIEYLFTILTKRFNQLKKFKEYWDNLYGQGLEITNWHLNGDTEPYDNFYDEALQVMPPKEEIKYDFR